MSLNEYLKLKNVVAIAEIDTRKLTGVLRDQGSLKGAIIAGDALSEADITGAVDAAKSFAGLKGMDLALEVTTPELYSWKEGSWKIGQGYPVIEDTRFHVVAYDFGIKKNILRLLADRGCRLTVVPAETTASAVLAMSPDGIFLSNGPGDPDPCDYAIGAIREIDRKSVV